MPEDVVPFSRQEFADWYNEYQERALRPAAQQIERLLGEFLERVSETDPRGRVRLGPPRIKSVNRAWRKLQKPEYLAEVNAPSDVPDVVDDLLGFRMICTNREDVDDLVSQLAEEFQELPFPLGTHGEEFFIAIESGSNRDYVSNPKPSGYRAFHLNLLTRVGTLRDGWAPVRAELQIRTLLQDAWGELTHEDTYKPDSEVSEFVQTLSLRMSEVLVVLDHLAQDLRSELDRELVDATEEPADDAPTSVRESAHSDSVVLSEGLEDAVTQYIRDAYSRLKKPQQLASFAWQLQREFGSEITADWLGYEKMSELLLAILPEEAVVTEQPGLLVPAGFDQESAEPPTTQGPPTQVPESTRDVAMRLKGFDSRLPLVSRERMHLAYGYLTDAHNSQFGQYGQPDLRFVNLVTRLARDLASSEGERIGRPIFNYIFMALFNRKAISRRLTSDDIALVYSNYVIDRCRRLGVLDQNQSTRSEETAALHDWLGPQAQTAAVSQPDDH